MRGCEARKDQVFYNQYSVLFWVKVRCRWRRSSSRLAVEGEGEKEGSVNFGAGVIQVSTYSPLSSFTLIT